MGTCARARGDGEFSRVVQFCRQRERDERIERRRELRTCGPEGGKEVETLSREREGRAGQGGGRGGGKEERKVALSIVEKVRASGGNLAGEENQDVSSSR